MSHHELESSKRIPNSPNFAEKEKNFETSEMSRHREWDLACKVYVGNLGNNASKNELEDVFSKYGPLRNVWVARNPPGFAFVEFEDPRDAEDAVRGLDGTRCCGTRIIVEMSNGRTRRSGGRRRTPPRRSREHQALFYTTSSHIRLKRPSSVASFLQHEGFSAIQLSYKQPPLTQNTIQPTTLTNQPTNQPPNTLRCI